MLFYSPADNTAKSTQQLIVFCHAGERTLLPLPETYEDAVAVAQKEFSLNNPLRFDTLDLPGWEGQKVKVHSLAWKGICTILKSVAVSELPHDGVPHHPQAQEDVPRPRIPSSSRRISTRVIPRKSVLPQEMIAVALQSSQAGRESIVHRVQDEAPEIENSEDSAAEEQNEDPSQPPSEDEDEAGKNKSAHQSQQPAAQKTPRERVVSAQSALTTPRVKQPFSPHERVVSTPTITLGSPLAKREKAGPSEPRDRFGGAVAQGDTRTVKMEKGLHPEQPKKEPPQIVNRVQAELAPEDDRFLISIELSDDEDSRSLFKTRGKHTVGKVLMQACRTFGIADQYDRARMILVIEMEEDEQVTESRFLCDKEDTMTRAGAQENARFIVQLTDDA